MHTRVNECACPCTYMKRPDLGVFLNHSFCSLRRSLALNLNLNLNLSALAVLNSTPLNSHGVPISRHSPGLSDMHNYDLVLLKFWEFELRSSWFYSKYSCSLSQLTSPMTYSLFYFFTTQRKYTILLHCKRKFCGT